MAAALKAVAAARSAAATATASGFRRMSSIFSGFNPPPPANPPPKAEPSTNLFVSGLSKRTTSEGLRDAFSKYGQVVHARVVSDRVSGYSKGFGFVRYATLDDASAGIKGMDGTFLDGWVIFAEYARPRPPPSAAPESSQPSSSYQSQSSHNTYYKNAMPGNPQSQSSYNTSNAAPGNPDSPPYNSYDHAATEFSPSPPSNQYDNYNNGTPSGNPQSSPHYQYSDNNGSVPTGNPYSEPNHQHGSYNNPAAANNSYEPVHYSSQSNPGMAQSEPVYQYGR